TLITADSLERGQAVVKRMGQDMHRGVRPVDERSIHPDFFAWLQHNPKGTIAVPRNSCQRMRRRDRRNRRRTQETHISASEFLSTRAVLMAHSSSTSRAQLIGLIRNLQHDFT